MMPTITPEEIAERRKRFGLGDAVATIAQPVAKFFDRVTGATFEKCIPCQQRREKLNELVPNLNPFASPKN